MAHQIIHQILTIQGAYLSQFGALLWEDCIQEESKVPSAIWKSLRGNACAALSEGVLKLFVTFEVLI
jgi:hypothetical protein